MKAKKCFITALAVLPLFGLAGPVQGDPCIRSCTSHLYVYLTYQPEGQVNTEKKTDMLKTTKKLSRDGRAGNNCLPHNILKAKQLGCSEAVRDLVRLHRSGDRQRQTVCEAVQYGETLIPRSNVQDEIYPKADWYRIDRMEAKAQRDAIRLRAEIDTIDHRRFRCTDGRAVVLQTGGPAPQNGTDAAPPPPPRVGTPAPPPPPSQTARPAPPPPPSLADSRQPDLYISEFTLNPAVPVQGQPVEVRIGVYNRGNAPSGPFTVKWWPGENYRDPACDWSIERLAARGGRILTCRYDGYPSWYGRLNTKVVADTDNIVRESVESNNSRVLPISVNKP